MSSNNFNMHFPKNLKVPFNILLSLFHFENIFLMFLIDSRVNAIVSIDN